MLVKYIGKQDAIVTEYNGKKYSFTRTVPVKDIPDFVFSFIKAGNTTLSELIVPFQPEQSAVDENKYKDIISKLDEKIAELEKDNARLKAKIEKLLARAEKNRQ